METGGRPNAAASQHMGEELAVWYQCQTFYGMKMTMHIDEKLLARVMEATGTSSKTRAVDLAPREMDRRAALLKLCASGLEATPDQLREAVDPLYDLAEMRRRETSTQYDRKPRSRG